MLLVQVQQFWTNTRHGLEILHQCGNRVKTKSQKVDLIPTFLEVTAEKLERGAFFPPPPLSWVGLMLTKSY